MLQRGTAGAPVAPLGRTLPGYRAQPRRAAGGARARRFLGARVAPRREDRIFPLGNGRFRLVTTITHVSERIVTEHELREMGLVAPAPDVPWTQEATEDGVRLRRRSSDNVEAVTDVHRALDYWLARLGDLEPRLKSQMPQWVREFGLATVREAIDLVRKDMPHRGPSERYGMLTRVFREIRTRRGGAR